MQSVRSIGRAPLSHGLGPRGRCYLSDLGSSLLDGEAEFVAVEIGGKPNHIVGMRLDNLGLSCTKDALIEVAGQIAVSGMPQVRGEDRGPPGTSLGRRLTDPDWRLKGAGEEPVRHAGRAEQPAMCGDPVESDTFIPKDPHSDAQRAKDAVELCADEVGEGESAVRGTHEQRPACVQSGDWLSRQMVVREEPACISFALERLPEQGVEHGIRFDG